jgi:hypothetical protein
MAHIQIGDKNIKLYHFGHEEVFKELNKKAQGKLRAIEILASLNQAEYTAILIKTSEDRKCEIGLELEWELIGEIISYCEECFCSGDGKVSKEDIIYIFS